MKNSKEDNFKKILKLAGEDKPSADFTAMVMSTIEADTKRELALKTLLQQEEEVGPALNFTANVMSQISAAEQSTIYKPIITPKAWYGIAAMMAVFVVAILVSNQSVPNTPDKGWLVNAISYTHAIPPIYLMAMVVISILLFVDYLINKMNHKSLSD